MLDGIILSVGAIIICLVLGLTYHKLMDNWDVIKTTIPFMFLSLVAGIYIGIASYTSCNDNLLSFNVAVSYVETIVNNEELYLKDIENIKDFIEIPNYINFDTPFKIKLKDIEEERESLKRSWLFARKIKDRKPVIAEIYLIK